MTWKLVFVETLEPEAGYEFINDAEALKPEAFFFFDDIAAPQPEVSVYMINTTGQETTSKVSRKGRWAHRNDSSSSRWELKAVSRSARRLLLASVGHCPILPTGHL